LGTIQKIAGLFFSFLGIGFVVLASISLLPAAGKPNLLGYFGVCSFAPVGTIILFLLSAIFFLLSFKVLKCHSRAAELAEIVVQNAHAHRIILGGN